MTGMAISFAELALCDLRQTLARYREEGASGVGSVLVTELLESIRVLAEHPDSGRIVPEFEHSFLRELIHPPFRILYHRGPRSVRMVRVLRSDPSRYLPVSGEST